MYNVVIAPKYQEMLIAISKSSGRRVEDIIASTIEKYLDLLKVAIEEQEKDTK